MNMNGDIDFLLSPTETAPGNQESNIIGANGDELIDIGSGDVINISVLEKATTPPSTHEAFDYREEGALDKLARYISRLAIQNLIIVRQQNAEDQLVSSTKKGRETDFLG